MKKPIEKFSGLVCICLGITVILWASAFVEIRTGLKGFGPAQLAELRFLVASIGISLPFFWRGESFPEVRHLPRLALSGIVGIGLYNFLLNTGELSVKAGSASFIVNTVPIFTAVFARLFLSERLSWLMYLGFGISFLGTALLAFDRASFRFSIGIVFILLAAISQAVYFILQKPLLKHYSPLQFTCFAFWFGALFLTPALPRAIAQIHSASMSSIVAVIYLGIFPAAIGFFTWATALSHMPVSRASVFLYLVPCVATALGIVILGEYPNSLHIFGGIITLAGVWIVNIFRDRQNTHCDSVVASSGAA